MDTNLKPKITVIMPAYNGGKYIAQAIDSVLSQTYQNFELLIINDGSTDNTEDIVKEYALRDKRIKLLNNEQNSGIVFSRNRGLEEAKTEYVAMIDCDDLAAATKLEKQINFLEKNKDFALIGSWVKIIDENGKGTGDFWKNAFTPEEIPIFLLFHNCFAQSSIVLRRSYLPQDKYIPGLEPTEDFDLWIRIADKYKTWNLSEVLLEYRVHAKNSQKILSEEKFKALNDILRRQLEKLKITPSERELMVHRTNFTYQGDDSEKFINDREHWLIQLKKANELQAVYDKKTFNKIIAERWFDSCYSNYTQGLPILKKFYASPLFKNFPINQYKKLLKFIIKIIFYKK